LIWAGGRVDRVKTIPKIPRFDSIRALEGRNDDFCVIADGRIEWSTASLDGNHDRKFRDTSIEENSDSNKFGTIVQHQKEAFKLVKTYPSRSRIELLRPMQHFDEPLN
jgi:hypothetical protein